MLKHKVPSSVVQEVTGRSSDTILSIVNSKGRTGKSGAPLNFTNRDVSRLYNVLQTMLRRAKAQKEEGCLPETAVIYSGQSVPTQCPLTAHYSAHYSAHYKSLEKRQMHQHKEEVSR